MQIYDAMLWMQLRCNALHMRDDIARQRVTHHMSCTPPFLITIIDHPRFEGAGA